MAKLVCPMCQNEDLEVVAYPDWVKIFCPEGETEWSGPSREDVVSACAPSEDEDE